MPFSSLSCLNFPGWDLQDSVEEKWMSSFYVFLFHFHPPKNTGRTKSLQNFGTKSSPFLFPFLMVPSYLSLFIIMEEVSVLWIPFTHSYLQRLCSWVHWRHVHCWSLWACFTFLVSPHLHLFFRVYFVNPLQGDKWHDLILIRNFFIVSCSLSVHILFGSEPLSPAHVQRKNN